MSPGTLLGQLLLVQGGLLLSLLLRLHLGLLLALLLLVLRLLQLLLMLLLHHGLRCFCCGSIWACPDGMPAR